MNSLISIEALNESDLIEYDAVLAAMGYESRARYACERLNISSKWMKTACGFPDRPVLAFEENQNWFRSAKFETPIITDEHVESWAAEWVSKIAQQASLEKRSANIFVDISSMSRLRLASVVAALMKCEQRLDLQVDFGYSVASWSPYNDDLAPIVKADPVLPFFGGWSSGWENPTIAIIGLGYEPDKAVGAYEFLEAAGVWVFVPTSKEERYLDDVEMANKSLLNRVNERQRIGYRVDQPVTLFGALESVVFGLLATSRPVILPFGPKIFALCSLLVGCLHREVPIWRISSGQYGAPGDRTASGEIILVRVVFGTIE